MGDSWRVNSEQTKRAYHEQIDRWWAEHKYMTFPPPRLGEDRSIDQNSLFHVWLTEFAAYLTPCHKKEVTKGMLEGIKTSVKGLFYRENPYEWMVHRVFCPLSKREKKGYTSSKSWLVGEMFLVLTWFQIFAAQQGCILESKGEFAKNQRESVQ
jgi:hypothetical protein